MKLDLNKLLKERWLTVSEQQLEQAIDTLRDSGVRITPQRHAVLEYLLKAPVHPTADEIYKALEGKFPNMSVATVYNNLRVLREIGLVRELTYGDSSSRFDSNTTDHYHIICDKCGKIVDFHYPVLDEVESLAEQVTGFDVSHHRMEIYGKCEKCQETATPTPSH
nr:peroxide-responsive transcriptional repressor PerR [Virgibacillus natechei]